MIISLLGATTALCLQAAMYFEARGESPDARLAIAQVIFNRVDSKFFPNDVCEVVTQKHQFSWYWDGKPETVTELKMWERIGDEVADVLERRKSGKPIFNSEFPATHFFDGNANPAWSKSDWFEYIGSIDGFQFYEETRRW